MNHRELCNVHMMDCGHRKKYFTLNRHRYIDILHITNLSFQFDYPVHHLSYPLSCHFAWNFYRSITFIFIPKSIKSEKHQKQLDRIDDVVTININRYTLIEIKNENLRYNFTRTMFFFSISHYIYISTYMYNHWKVFTNYNFFNERIIFLEIRYTAIFFTSNL